MIDGARRLVERHPWAFRFVMLMLGLGLAAGAFLGVAFGTCHDSGGFCEGEFTSTNLEAYTTGAVLAGLGGATLALVASRRWRVLAAAFLLGVTVAVTVAVLAEATV